MLKIAITKYFADRLGYVITEVPYAETDGIILVEDGARRIS
jgi:hypothetical protein